MTTRLLYLLVPISRHSLNYESCHFLFWNRTINIIWNITRNTLDNRKHSTIPKPQHPHPWSPGCFPRPLHNLPTAVTQLQIKALGSRLCYTWHLKLMTQCHHPLSHAEFIHICPPIYSALNEIQVGNLQWPL